MTGNVWYYYNILQEQGYFQALWSTTIFLEEDCFVLFCFFRGGGEMLKYFVVGAQPAFQNNLGWRHVQVDSDSV